MTVLLAKIKANNALFIGVSRIIKMFHADKIFKPTIFIACVLKIKLFPILFNERFIRPITFICDRAVFASTHYNINF